MNERLHFWLSWQVYIPHQTIPLLYLSQGLSLATAITLFFKASQIPQFLDPLFGAEHYFFSC
jgi:hypothetical protein